MGMMCADGNIDRKYGYGWCGTRKMCHWNDFVCVNVYRGVRRVLKSESNGKTREGALDTYSSPAGSLKVVSFSVLL